MSRSRVFQLKPLDDSDLFDVAKAAIKDKTRGYGKWNVEFESGAMELLVEKSGGDARSLLNALELAIETTPDSFPPPLDDNIYISMPSQCTMYNTPTATAKTLAFRAGGILVWHFLPSCRYSLLLAGGGHL